MRIGIGLSAVMMSGIGNGVFLALLCFSGGIPTKARRRMTRLLYELVAAVLGSSY